MAYQVVFNLTTSEQRFIVIKDKGEHQNALFHSKKFKMLFTFPNALSLK